MGRLTSLSRVLGRTTLVLTMLFSGENMLFAQVQCWAPRQDEGPVNDKRWARHLNAMVAAETIVKQSQEFLSPPVPVRMRTTMATDVYEPTDSRIFVRAYPERTSVGINLWTGECGISPQAERVAGSVGRVSVFFNHLSKDMFMDFDEVPKRTGTVGGYPEYGGWVVITRDGRLPWIPQTLGDRLDRIGAAREKAVAEWNILKRSRNNIPDQETVDRTAAMLRKKDPAGADKYLNSMKQLAKDVQADRAKDAAREARLNQQVSDYKAYRASFTAEQLAMPAIWADADGSAQRSLEAQIAELQALGEEDQRTVDEKLAHSRSLEKDARSADKAGNPDQGKRLRERANELAKAVKQIRKDHQEQAALRGEALRAVYELNNLKPGQAEQAMAYKMDPTFPDRRQPGQIQVITVLALTLTDQDIVKRPELKPRKEWLDRVKPSIDYAALATLLD